MYKLTEEDLKTLKLFSYYVQSYGEKECDLTVDFYECSQDYTPDVWYSYSHTQIEGYDKINELIDRIAESLELEDYMEDCENHANVTFNLDAKERKLFIRVHEQVRSENEMGTVFEDDDFDNSIKEFMSQLLTIVIVLNYHQVLRIFYIINFKNFTVDGKLMKVLMVNSISTQLKTK
jgi:hypothetical protein